MTAHRTPTFSQTFRVRYEECGPGGSARASTYLRYLQDLAFAHSAALGYPLSWYETHRLFWLMRRIHLVVSSGARYGEEWRGTVGRGPVSRGMAGLGRAWWGSVRRGKVL